MQVIGLCRFSYPAIGGFQINHDSLAARIDYLYAPARIEQRLDVFNRMTLPPLRAQTDPAFQLVVVTGRAMPKRYQNDLRRMLSDVPQATLVMPDPGQHRAVMRRVINQAKTASTGQVAQFRMDDDDAVAIDFVENLRRVAQDKRAADLPYAVDYTLGYAIALEQGAALVQRVNEKHWTPALAVISDASHPRSIMNYAHHTIDQRLPVTYRDEEPMFLRGVTEQNDSGGWKTSLCLDQPSVLDRDMLWARFRVDV